MGNNECAGSADCLGRQLFLGAIEGERNVSEKQTDMKKLIEKMRANRDTQNRKTEALPVRRSRRRMQKAKQGDGSWKGTVLPVDVNVEAKDSLHADE